MNIKHCLLSVLTILFLNLTNVNAQNHETSFQTKRHPGSVKIYASNSLDKLMEKKKLYDSFHSNYTGYRVQIYFAAGNNSKQGAFDAAQELHNIDTTIPAYVSYNAPYYRVRVGNYKTKFDAEMAKEKLESHFNGCFVVKEEIKATDEDYQNMKAVYDSTNMNLNTRYRQE